MIPEDIVALEQKLRQECNLSIKLEMGQMVPMESPYSVEVALMLNANDKRRREFYNGRRLARKAMKRAGFESSGLGRGALGNPLWPAGCLGSITHDRRWAAAVAASGDGLLGLGIDLLEHPEAVGDELSSMILSEPEGALLSMQFPALPSTGLAFSLKESVVKVVSVLSGSYVDLLDIKLTESNGRLAARVKGMPVVVPCIVYPSACGLFTFSYFLKEENNGSNSN